MRSTSTTDGRPISAMIMLQLSAADTLGLAVSFDTATAAARCFIADTDNPVDRVFSTPRELEDGDGRRIGMLDPIGAFREVEDDARCHIAMLEPVEDLVDRR